MRNIKKIIDKNMIISIIIFLVGLVLFLRPDTTIKSIAIIIGILLIIMCTGPILELLKENEKKLSFSIAPSVILFVIAFILFFKPELLISIIPILIGVLLVMLSAFRLQNIYNIKKVNGVFNIWTLIITFIILVLGLFLIINPFGGVVTATKLIGIFLMVYSVLDIIDNIILKKIVK